MGQPIKFKYGTEAQILSLTLADENWIDRAFYYPDDKEYFYQARDGEMKIYGAGDVSVVGTGVSLNGKVLGGIKTKIEKNDKLNTPANHDYNTYSLDIEGQVDNAGRINIM